MIMDMFSAVRSKFLSGNSMKRKLNLSVKIDGAPRIVNEPSHRRNKRVDILEVLKEAAKTCEGCCLQNGSILDVDKKHGITFSLYEFLGKGWVGTLSRRLQLPIVWYFGPVDSACYFLPVCLFEGDANIEKCRPLILCYGSHLFAGVLFLLLMKIIPPGKNFLGLELLLVGIHSYMYRNFYLEA